MSLAAAESRPAPQPARAADSDNTFGRIGSTLSRWVGLGDSKPEQAKPAPAPKPAPRTSTTAAAQPKPKPQPEARAAAPAAAAPAVQPVRTTAANGPAMMSGASPVVAADSFESRFGSMR
jgi:hypothetical protein